MIRQHAVTATTHSDGHRTSPFPKDTPTDDGGTTVSTASATLCPPTDAGLPRGNDPILLKSFPLGLPSGATSDEGASNVVVAGGAQATIRLKSLPFFTGDGDSTAGGADAGLGVPEEAKEAAAAAAADEDMRAKSLPLPPEGAAGLGVSTGGGWEDDDMAGGECVRGAVATERCHRDYYL